MVSLSTQKVIISSDFLNFLKIFDFDLVEQPVLFVNILFAVKCQILDHLFDNLHPNFTPKSRILP